MTGRIVILNGAPRSGKSSIARAMQAGLDGVWINLGVDAAMAAQPPGIAPGIGLRPGGERPDLEPIVQQLYGALFDSMAAYARSGVDVVSDLGLHDFYSRPLGVLADATRRLAGLPVMFVGVRCPIDVIMARRNAEPQGGHYETGAVAPPTVTRWQDAVHVPGVYDLEIESAVTSAEAAASMIGTMLQSWPEVTAFDRLREIQAS